MGELEEKETPSTESTAQQEVLEEPKETDKMLDKKDIETVLMTTQSDKAPSPSAEKKQLSKPTIPNVNERKINDELSKNKTEEIIGIPTENGSDGDSGGGSKANEKDEEKKISTEEREVKPKKIPIGGLKLPGFFMKTKPKTEGDGADGELLEKDPKEEEDPIHPPVIEEKSIKKDVVKPRNSFGQRLRNFFVRKHAAEKQAKQTVNGDTDAKSEATAEAAPTNERNEYGALPQKRGLLNAIKLPIANLVPKKKSDDDVELGLGKAGLASMETLDDSLKDQDCADRVAIAGVKTNGSDDFKLKKSTSAGDIKGADTDNIDEKSPDDDEIPVSLIERLRSYKCSVDDALIAFGILLLILLLAVIGYVLTHERLVTPPLREGRFISAVTSCGLVEGVKEDSAFAFRGIPYALPPIDDLRWRPAQLVQGINNCWNGTLQVHNNNVLCTQMLGNGTIVGEEDCLYLDVITPAVKYEHPLPVVVLIGAESFTGPSPGILRPSARYSRSHRILFVRPNFRLGVFGFLALNALSKDAYPHSSGNYALTDIIAVLKWIQLNIYHFGGDPKSITLLGHRAGATLVSALVTSKQAENLYTRAWASSASAVFPGKPLQESEKQNQEFMQAIECQDVKCLRAATMEQIWAATPDTWLHFPADLPTKEEKSSTVSHHEWLVLDGNILQEHPAESWKKEPKDHPILVIGSTAHESHTFKLRERHSNWTAEQVRAYLEASQIGVLNLTDEVIARYNATNYRELTAIITDIRTVCPLLINARLQPTVPFYVVTQGEGEDQLATVDSDVQAILGRYEPPSVEQRRFVSAMQQLFYYYVAHGKVPQYDQRRRVINVGQDPLTQEDYPNCNYWISKDIVPRYARID